MATRFEPPFLIGIDVAHPRHRAAHAEAVAVRRHE